MESMFRLLVTCAALLVGVPQLAAAPLPTEPPREEARDTPEGLSAPDWGSIRAAYEAGLHAFAAHQDGGHAARNPGQRWLARFDGRGFLVAPDDGGWEWGLELRGYGLGGNTVLLDNPALGTRAEGSRLSWERDAVLEEWFLNDRRGLEQGWTFRERPRGEGEGPLRLELGVRGGLKPMVATESVAFADAAGSTVLSYGGLKAWDADGKILAARFVAAGENAVAVEVEERGARYPVTVDPIAQQAYLKASNTGAGDDFGMSVAISGDTVVVGAPLEDSAATGIDGDQADDSAEDAGAAYVFVRTGSQWSQQAYLKASNTSPGDNFGVSVAVSGDTVVVGAHLEASSATGIDGNQADDSAEDAGAAYVFVRTGPQWSQQAYLKASNAEAGDKFGQSVAVSGDTVVVGAEGEASSATGVNGNQADNSAKDAGAAYVFARTGSQWSQQAYLKASNAEWFDIFGWSVAVSGDTVVVGAMWEDSAAAGVDGNQADNSVTAAGAAYVFTRTGAQWSQQAYLKASNPGELIQFGWSVAISGDTVVVGAPFENSAATGIDGNQADDSAEDAGAAYVFVRTGSQWSQQAYLKASNTEADDWFGMSVAVSGDTVVVGAEAEASAAPGIDGNQADNSASQAGAAYLFARTGTQWSQQAYLKASNPGVNDRFGESVAVSGDTVVIGAEGEDSAATGVAGNQADNSAFQAGAAYVFGVGSELLTLAKTHASVPGVLDGAFAAPGSAAVGAAGQTVFDHGLAGAGAVRGRNRAAFSTVGDRMVAVLLQSQSPLGGFGGLPPGARAAAFSLPSARLPGMGLVQATVAGPGVNAASNRILLADNGAFLSPVFRTGQAVAELGGARPRAFLEILQHDALDLVVVSHRLLAAAADGVNAGNDTGLLPLTHAGALAFDPPPREGDPAHGGGGNFGQFSGRAAAGTGDTIHFGAQLRPPVGPALQALFQVREDGALPARSALQGDLAPGAGGAAFRAFPALSQTAGGHALFRATLAGSAAAENEGIWRGDGTLILRKGQQIDPVDLPGVVVNRILRFWPAGADQVVIQTVLRGPGVTGATNQALLLRQADGEFQVLLRSGTPAPGAGSATLMAIQAVEVDPGSGSYAALGSLRGAPAASNQALWRGDASLGDDGDNRQLRLPRLMLRKGDPYTSSGTFLATIRGLSLRPAPDRTGAGGRGLGQVQGPGGHVAVVILADRRTQELVVAEP